MIIDLLKLLWQAQVRSWHDTITRHAAAVAYYAVFALAPLVLIGIKVTGWAVGPKAAQADFSQGLHQLLGEQAAHALEDVLHRAATRPPGSPWVTVIEIGAIIYAVGRLFGVLQSAMNTIWRVRARPGRRVIDALRERLLSFLMVALAGPLMLAGLALSALLNAGTRHLTHAWWLHRPLGTASSMLVLILLIGFLFRILPDARVDWADVWIGAIFTAVLLAAGEFLVGRYLAHITGYSINGVVGSLAVLLIWVYYCTCVLFFGAEFTLVYVRWLGHHIQPANHAITLSEADLARRGIPSREYLEQLAGQQARQ